MYDTASSQIDYMVRRTISLILADTRGAPSIGEPGSFAPVYGREMGVQSRPFFRPVLHLLNVWLAMRGLTSSILPFLGGVYDDVEVFRGSDGNQEAGRVDWHETFGRWAAGGNGLVWREYARVERRADLEFAGGFVDELLLHGRELSRIFGESRGAANATLGRMLSDIERWTAALCAFQERHSIGRYRLSAEVTNKIRNEFVSDVLGGGNQMLREYREGAGGCIRDPRMGVTATVAVSRMYELRKQYLSADVWVIPGMAGLEVSASGTPASLYEVWCFMECINSLVANDSIEVTQRCFLKRRQTEPTFELGRSHFAYFDYWGRAFSSVADSLVFSAAGRGALIPRVHVEWFIRSRNEFEDSVVIDTKHRSWDSGEALKVLGYMMSFGVSRGAVIFSGDIGALASSNRCRLPGLYFFERGGQRGARLWVLQMCPAAEVENQNAAAMTQFVREALL
jgi:hypothetical protein